MLGTQRLIDRFQSNLHTFYLYSPSPTAMASLADLFEFLASPNPSARHLALQNLVGHTPKTAAQRHIFIPSTLAPLDATEEQTAGAGGGGLLGVGSGGKMGEEDKRKVGGIRDMMGLCRDQAVSLCQAERIRWTAVKSRTYETVEPSYSSIMELMCQMTAHDALSALINLSDNFAVARHIAADEEYIVWLISYTAVNPYLLPLFPYWDISR
jgi:hypothetical protein